jgi:hypothetical protein
LTRAAYRDQREERQQQAFFSRRKATPPRPRCMSDGAAKTLHASSLPLAHLLFATERRKKIRGEWFGQRTTSAGRSSPITGEEQTREETRRETATDWD